MAGFRCQCLGRGTLVPTPDFFSGEWRAAKLPELRSLPLPPLPPGMYYKGGARMGGGGGSRWGPPAVYGHGTTSPAPHCSPPPLSVPSPPVVGRCNPPILITSSQCPPLPGEFTAAHIQGQHPKGRLALGCQVSEKKSFVLRPGAGGGGVAVGERQIQLRKIAAKSRQTCGKLRGNCSAATKPREASMSFSSCSLCRLAQPSRRKRLPPPCHQEPQS